MINTLVHEKLVSMDLQWVRYNASVQHDLPRALVIAKIVLEDLSIDP